MADARKLTKVFRALSVETRVRIVQLLKENALCVNALAARLEVTPAAVSQHLRVLRDAGLVEVDRRGYFSHYRLAPEAAEGCRTVIDSLFGSKKGGVRCVAEKRSAKGRKN